ncbi:hypothetical protein ACHAXT_004385 [Thalassiosira profunda]
MLFHIASTIVAGAVVQAAAEVPAAAVSAPLTEDQLGAVPTNDNGERKAHRLLQKFKNRRARAFQTEAEGRSAAEENDVGILAKGGERRLADYDYYCPRDTCPSALCDCADSGGSLEDCTEELKSVCAAGRLGDCVFRDYVQVYEEVYCPFVACTEEGFRENQCDCAFYELYCERLNSNECSTVIHATSDEADKKPFFGCDETELKNVCGEATACKSRGDLQGLPDLGTWQGSVMTGIKNVGERAVGRSVAAGVAVLSALWLMVHA